MTTVTDEPLTSKDDASANPLPESQPAPAVRPTAPADWGLRIGLLGVLLTVPALAYVLVCSWLVPAPPELAVVTRSATAASADTGGPVDSSAAMLDLAVVEGTAVLAPLTSTIGVRGEKYDASTLDRFREAPEAAVAGAGEVPRAKRWQISYADGINEVSYAKQLDSLGIELGVLVGGGKIEYVQQLSAAAPKRRDGPLKDETRLYMSWNRGDLLEADRTLLARAGVEAADKIVLHFYPSATEQRLADAELAYRKREPQNIAFTRFSLRPKGESWELFVVDQRGRD